MQQSGFEVCDAFFYVTKLAGAYILAISVGKHGSLGPDEERL